MYIIFLHLIVLTQQQHDFANDTTVMLLDQQSFVDYYVGMNQQSWFILFYKPTCPHCQRVMPVWEQLSINHQREHCIIAAVNCIKEGDLCNQFNINGVPTMILLSQNGNQHIYSDGRSIEPLTAYLNNMWNSTEIEKKHAFNEFLDTYNVSVMLLIIFIFLLGLYCLITQTNGSEYNPIEQDVQQSIEMPRIDTINA